MSRSSSSLPGCPACEEEERRLARRRRFIPEVGWKWLKWTFGVWSDPANRTRFGIDIGPLEIVWRLPGYRP